jgi:hypothetical protein
MMYFETTKLEFNEFQLCKMWAHLGLNQGPPDYESGATNQLSYRPQIFDTKYFKNRYSNQLPRCLSGIGPKYLIQNISKIVILKLPVFRSAILVNCVNIHKQNVLKFAILLRLRLLSCFPSR